MDNKDQLIQDEINKIANEKNQQEEVDWGFEASLGLLANFSLFQCDECRKIDEAQTLTPLQVRKFIQETFETVERRMRILQLKKFKKNGNKTETTLQEDSETSTSEETTNWAEEIL